MDIKRLSFKGKHLMLLVSISLVILVIIGCAAQKESPKPQDTTQQTTQAPATQTSDKQNNSHSKMGVNCNQCHSDGEGQKVSSEQCLSCHKSISEVIAKTNDMKPNPHEPYHYDTDNCMVCHAIHGKSQMMCSQCHEFPWIKELGDKWEKMEIK